MATLAVALCLPGKYASIPAPPLVTALVTDPSVHTQIHASGGYLSGSHSQCERLLGLVMCVFSGEGRDGDIDLHVIYVLPRAMTCLAGKGVSMF